jgi:predicted O-methyltransferase YrrM
MLGSAAGTTPTQFLAIFGSTTRIDAVEIDPEIVTVGRRFFALQDGSARYPNYTVYVDDARAWLTRSDEQYDVIGLDAYRQPYIPFHLTTVEFFQQVRQRLCADGVVVVNAGNGPNGDDRLARALASTMQAVFAEIYMIDTVDGGNTLLIGVTQPVGDGVANLQRNADSIELPALRTVMELGIVIGRPRRFDPSRAVTPYTDDWAPVERLVDQVIVDAARTISAR